MRIYGELISVSFRVFGEKDEYGNDIETYSEPIEVENVLVGRGDTVDLIQDGQPYAIRADKRFCFPKGFEGDLRDAIITRGGEQYKVVGAPSPYTEENLPTLIPWNIKAEAVRYDG